MTIPGVTPFSGTLPVENEPASFPTRAEALFAWLTGNAAPEIDAVADGINAALNDNGTVLDTAGKAIALSTNANTIVATAGTGNAYTITPAVAVSAYEAGQVFMVRTNRANTGPVTLQVGALAATPVRKSNSTGTGFVELVANDWLPGDIHIIGFRNAQFELLSIPISSFVRNNSAQTISAPWTFTVPATFSNGLNVTGGAFNGTVGATTPAAGAFTTIQGASLRVESAVASIDLIDTNSGTDTKRSRVEVNDNQMAFATFNDAGGFVGFDYRMPKAASGATAHIFNIGGAERFRIENASARATVTGGVGTGFLIELSNASGFGAPGFYFQSTTEVSGSIEQPVFQPRSTGGHLLGRPSLRWGNIYLTAGPNVSSDIADKDEIEAYTPDELAAARRIRSVKFRRKSTNTRHGGYIAQEIVAAFVAEGFPPEHPVNIGLLSVGEDGLYGVDQTAVLALVYEAAK